MDNVQNCDSYINIPSSQTYVQAYPIHYALARSDVCRPKRIEVYIWTNRYKLRPVVVLAFRLRLSVLAHK
jgi:hypothetical protein